jgi:hypothetical protein
MKSVRMAANTVFVERIAAKHTECPHVERRLYWLFCASLAQKLGRAVRGGSRGGATGWEIFGVVVIAAHLSTPKINELHNRGRRLL